MKLKWNIEDNSYWETEGRFIAIKNLTLSSLNLILAFIIWIMWSALAVYIVQVRSDFTNSDLYWLTAIPLLSAAFLRIPYSFIVPWVGGARWNAISTFILILPLSLTFFCFHYELSLEFFYLAAFGTGMAGASFASSCANISFLFPYRYKSIALGINSSIGNLGVGIGQWLLPLIFLQLGSNLFIDTEVILLKQLDKISLVLIFLCFFMSIVCFFFMDNVNLEKQDLKTQLKVLKDRECWSMCFLYTFTFGAYIGLSSIFPMFIAKYYGVGNSTTYAFWGATLSALMRPFGHVVAKFIGAVTSTIIAFVLLIIGSFGLIYSIFSVNDFNTLYLFVFFYMILFIGTGLGKGTTTAMIPEIYILRSIKRGEDKNSSSHDISSVVGFSSAIATFGAFIIPLFFDFSTRFFGVDYVALGTLGIFFVICLIYTILVYGRKVDSNPLYANGQIVDRPSRMTAFEKMDIK